MRQAFTLIELLVVISVIALLIAILLPTLSSARESALRVNCASQQRQFGVIVTAYAVDSDGVLPRGGRDNAIGTGSGQHFVEHTPFISSELHTYVLDSAGTSSQATRGAEGYYDTGSSAVLDCPSFERGFQDSQVRYQGSNRIGWVIGYQYLAGRPYTEAYNRANPIAGSNNAEWRSMLKLADVGNGAIITDYNNWTNSSWVFVAHTQRGALDIGGGGRAYVNTAAQGARPETIGGVGGNVTYLDGSVFWKPLSEMNEHHSIENTPNFPAYW